MTYQPHQSEDLTTKPIAAERLPSNAEAQRQAIFALMETIMESCDKEVTRAALAECGLYTLDDATKLMTAEGDAASNDPRCHGCGKPRREFGLCYRCSHGGEQ